MRQFWQNFKYALAYTVLAVLMLLAAFVALPGLVVAPALWLASTTYIFVGVIYGLLSFTTLMSVVIILSDRGVLDRWLTSAEELIDQFVML